MEHNVTYTDASATPDCDLLRDTLNETHAMQMIHFTMEQQIAKYALTRGDVPGMPNHCCAPRACHCRCVRRVARASTTRGSNGRSNIMTISLVFPCTLATRASSTAQ